MLCSIIKLVKEFNVHKNTMILKMNVVKLIDKYPKLMKSLVTLGLKNYYENIKQICNENPNKF